MPDQVGVELDRLEAEQDRASEAWAEARSARGPRRVQLEREAVAIEEAAAREWHQLTGGASYPCREL